MKVYVEKTIGSGTLRIETGMLAKQAAGSCLIQFGETVVLTAVASGPPRPGIADFFPLTCDYRERTAAAGKFPGGFLKREGRPTTKETLTSRLMDRPIRPSFPSGSATKFRFNRSCWPAIGKTTATCWPWSAPRSALGSLAVALHGTDRLGPARPGRRQVRSLSTQDELEESDLDLIVSGNQESVLMIEGFARELPEDEMLEAIKVAHGYIQQICDLQRSCSPR